MEDSIFPADNLDIREKPRDPPIRVALTLTSRHLMKKLLRQKGTQRLFHRNHQHSLPSGRFIGWEHTHTLTHTQALFEALWKMKNYLGKVIMWEDGLEDSRWVFCERKNGPIDNCDSARRLKDLSIFFSYICFSQKGTTMHWLKHMVFWLPSALINGESKTYKDCQLSKKENTILSQQHDLE